MRNGQRAPKALNALQAEKLNFLMTFMLILSSSQAYELQYEYDQGSPWRRLAASKQEQENMEKVKEQMESLVKDLEKKLADLNSKLTDADYLDTLSPEGEQEFQSEFALAG